MLGIRRTPITRALAVPVLLMALTGATVVGAPSALAATGDATGYLLPATADGPSAIVSTASNDLWLTLSTSGALASISTTGAVTSHPVAGLAADAAPAGIAQDTTGRIWFTEKGGNAVSSVSSTGAGLQRVPLPGAGSEPTAITAGPDGNLWFTESAGDRIGRVTPTGALTEFALANGAAPSAITAGPDGNVWFTMTGTNAIGRITPSGSIATFPLTGPAAGLHGIAAGPDGNLWFTQSMANRIGRISPAGALAEFAVPTPAGAPWGIGAGPDGNVWFTEATSGRVGRVTPSGTITEFSLPSTSGRPVALAAGADGNIWVVEQQADRISRLLTGVTPVVKSVPAVSGTSTAVGSVLSATTGAWSYLPTGYAFQWQRCLAATADSCADVAGATASTWTVTTSDTGVWLRVLVRATNANGSSAQPAASLLSQMGNTPIPPAVVGGSSVAIAPGVTATLRAVNGTKRKVLRSYRVRFSAAGVRGRVRMTLVSPSGVEVLVIAKGKWTTTIGPTSQSKKWRRIPLRVPRGVYTVKAVFTPHPTQASTYAVATLNRTLVVR